jgi:hypothetical protein
MWKHGMIQCSKKYIEAIGCSKIFNIFLLFQWWGVLGAIGEHGRKEIGWHCKRSILFIFGGKQGHEKKYHKQPAC